MVPQAHNKYGVDLVYRMAYLDSGIRFVTPEQRHAGEDRQILSKRKEVYEAAKCSKLGRWKSRQTRNWEHIKEVWLNPPCEHLRAPEKGAMAV